MSRTNFFLIVPHLLALVSAAPYALPKREENGGSSTGTPVSGDEAGASGSDNGAFTISKAGMAAIISVVVIVAVLGIASVTLYYIAKKRQWEIRKSLSRASRRLTMRRSSRAPTSRHAGRTPTAAKFTNLSSSPPTKAEKKANRGTSAFDLEKKAPAKISSKSVGGDGDAKLTALPAAMRK